MRQPNEYEVTHVTYPHWIKKLFGAKVIRKTYHGTGSTWRHADTNEPADVETSQRLTDHFNKILFRYGGL